MNTKRKAAPKRDAELWQRYWKDPTQENLDAIVLANERLVHWCAVQVLRKGGDDFDDLYQDGMIELMRLVPLFDPTRGFSFSTFAVACIPRVMIRCLLRRKFGPNVPPSARRSKDPIPIMGSIDSWGDDDGRPAAERFAGDDGRVDQALADLRLDLDEAIAKEPSGKRRRLMRLRYQKGEAFRAIAEVYKVSPMTVAGWTRSIEATHGEAIPKCRSGRRKG